MYHLIRGSNFPFLLIALLFVLTPSKVQVEGTLTRLVQQYQLAPEWQWAILLFAAFLPAIVLAIPVYRSAVLLFEEKNPNFKRQFAFLAAAAIVLLSYCVVRLLYWIA